MSAVCIDASVVIKWLIHESDSDLALDLLEHYKKNGVILLAPSLLDYEVGSVLRQKFIRKNIDQAILNRAVELYQGLDLRLMHPVNLVMQSLAMAETLGQPTIYDTSYLLFARSQKTLLITADRRFYQSAKTHYSNISLMSDEYNAIN